MKVKDKSIGFPSVDKPWLKYYNDDFNNEELPKMTIYQHIWENNKDYLSDVALRYYGKKITYRTLFEQIRTAASAFHTMGIRAGDIVTIMSMHTPETIICIYALNYIGAVANMVYMTLSEKEILQTLKNTDSKMFLVLDIVLQKIPALNRNIKIPVVALSVATSMPLFVRFGYMMKAKPGKNVYMGFQDFLSKANISAPIATDYLKPAVIVYTSGTTGEPKGVVLSSNNINAVSFEYKLSPMHFGRKEKYLNAIPTFLGFGITMMHMSLMFGLDTILWIQLNPDIIADAFIKYKPNHLVAGPLLLEPLLKKVHHDLDYLVNFAGGGDSPTLEKEREINRFLEGRHSSAKYVTGYGMTEFSATVCTGYNDIYKEGSLGIPLPKVNVKIIDVDSGTELGFNKIGEVCFSTPSMMTEYYKNADATNEVIEVDEKGVRWLHTGDLARIDEDGFIFFEGRIKRIYLVRGKDKVIYKLFPRRIEEIVDSIEEVDHCGVVVQEDEEMANVPIIFVSKSENNLPDEKLIKEIRELTDKELPDHMRPKEIYVLGIMPLTPSGKVDYRTLENEAKNRMQQCMKWCEEV